MTTQSTTPPPGVTTAPVPLWVGTYPVAGAGTPTGLGEGIWRVDLDPRTGALAEPRQVVVTPSPSFVLAHPGGTVVYAADESQVGAVTAFAVEADGTLTPLARVGSGGAYPCHLALDEGARTLYVANYASGTVAVLPLEADGRFAPAVLDAAGPVQVFGHEGSGPDADRQEGPHAHFVVVAPGGAHLLVVDLGTDELRRYARAADGLLTPDGIAARFPAGAGPRHLVFVGPDATHRPGAGTTAVVVGELDGRLHVLDWDATTATGTLVASEPTQAAAPAAGSPTGLRLSRTGPDPAHPQAVPSLGAHVTLDGDRLLVGVRGTDVLAEHTLAPLGAGAVAVRPRHRADHALPGSWPRHHAVVAGWTVVAQQVDGGVVCLAPDGTVVGHAAVPAPTCLTPVVPA
ncbi:lactonase family protein [Cellulomonas soli]